MKKTKLFLSIASLCISLAVLCFGVFAATRAEFNISGRMTYEVVDAYIEVDTVVYASNSPSDFNNGYEIALALKSTNPNLNKLGLRQYNTGRIDFEYNSLEDSYGECEIDDVELEGYYGYYFVITAKNLSRDVQVYMTVDATINSNNVIILNSGLVPSVEAGGSKIVVAFIVDELIQPIDAENFTRNMQAGSVPESNFELYEDDEFGLYGAKKKAGITYSGPLVIPESIDGETVECVGDFSDLTQITEIYVPETVQAFKEQCFAGCSSIETLTVPFIGVYNVPEENLTSFDTLSYFFYTDGDPDNDDFYQACQYYVYKRVEKCYYSYLPYSLKTVIVTSALALECSADGIQGERETAISSVFKDTFVKNVIILSDHIDKIGDGMFYNSEVKNIYFKNKIKEIGNYSFYDCETYRKIPSSVKMVGIKSFGSTAYESSLFYNGLAIASAYDDSNIKYLIGVDSENLPTAITEGMLDGVIYIPSKAFLDCTELTEIYIPTSVQQIGEYAFAGCSGIQSLTLPFWGKMNYESVDDLLAIEGITREELENGDCCAGMISWLFDSEPRDGMIRVDCYRECYVPENWTYLEILEGAYCMNYYALNDDYYTEPMPLQTIVLPSTMKRLEEYAFYENNNIVSFICKSTLVPYTDEYAFDSATIQTVYVPAESVSAYSSNSYWSNFNIQPIPA